MLIVETYIAPSKIHGLGVFAARPLKAGTCVWVFDPAIDQEISARELRGLPDRVRAVLLSRSFVNDQGRTILSRDNGVFLNHSETPNLSGGLEGSVAIRDIARDEELTEDYRLLAPGACRAFLDGRAATARQAPRRERSVMARMTTKTRDEAIRRLGAATGIFGRAWRLFRR